MSGGVSGVVEGVERVDGVAFLEFGIGLRFWEVFFGLAGLGRRDSM